MVQRAFKALNQPCQRLALPHVCGIYEWHERKADLMAGRTALIRSQKSAMQSKARRTAERSQWRDRDISCPGVEFPRDCD